MALVKIGGLWKNKGKGYSGKISIGGGGSITLKDGDRILVFKNEDKEEGDKRPDITLSIERDVPPPKPSTPTPQDDDIPF